MNWVKTFGFPTNQTPVSAPTASPTASLLTWGHLRVPPPRVFACVTPWTGMLPPLPCPQAKLENHTFKSPLSPGQPPCHSWTLFYFFLIVLMTTWLAMSLSIMRIEALGELECCPFHSVSPTPRTVPGTRLVLGKAHAEWMNEWTGPEIQRLHMNPWEEALRYWLQKRCSLRSTSLDVALFSSP